MSNGSAKNCVESFAKMALWWPSLVTDFDEIYMESSMYYPTYFLKV